MNSRDDDQLGYLSLEVLRRVSEKDGTHPKRLPPLYETIDPWAIDAIPLEATLEIPYAGFQLTIHGDGEILVTPLEQAPKADE